ncbi:unnamed protein product [Dibothriocephalus latus]|uniref:Fibronectin type-III domain-containing protein n=1 Tax=Dibothriocephalus latus TaxID=60516 RepID=A0A3P7LG88_DIBLA|nr:unnamed protein product [Dibothriocephalus latus]
MLNKLLSGRDEQALTESSTFSVAHQTPTPPAAEGNVKNVKAIVKSPTKIDLYWDAGPSPDNEPQVFEVTVTPSDRPTITSTEKWVDIEDLEPSTEYEFHVYRRQKDSTRKEPGVKITAKTLDPATPPAAEVNVQDVKAVTKSPTKIDLLWDAGPSPDNEPQVFEVTVTPGDRPVITSPEKWVEVEDLEPSTEYEFHVYLRQEDGTRKEPGVKITARTLDPAEENVQNVNAVTKSSTQIDLTWDASPRSDNESQEFEFTVTPGDRAPIITAERHASVESLNSSTEYEFHVYLRDKNGARKEPGVNATVATFVSERTGVLMLRRGGCRDCDPIDCHRKIWS